MLNSKPKPFFENLQALLKAQELTFKQLSEKSQVHVQTLYGLKSHDPSQNTLNAIAKALKVSTDELLGNPFISGTKGIIQAPVWELENYGKDLPPSSLRELVNAHPKSFGLILDPRDSGYPKGSIFYFTPEKEAQDGDLVLVKANDFYFVKKMYIERGATKFEHLRFDELESFSDGYEILGTCFEIVIDPYYAKFVR